MECGWRCLGGALELGVFVGGPWKGNCSAAAAAIPMGRGVALLNISVLVFLFPYGFPFSFTDVHSVCGFIVTPHSARYEVQEAVKEDPCLVRYDAVLYREMVTRQLGGPCIHRRGCQIMAFESVEHRVVVIPVMWWQQTTTKRQCLPVDVASYPRIH